MMPAAPEECLAERLRSMAKRGQSAYACVDGEEVVDLPATSMQGRAGTLGKTFSGCLNLRSGTLVVNCAEDLTFWLKIDLSKVPAFSAAPGGIDAQRAKDEYESALLSP